MVLTSAAVFIRRCAGGNHSHVRFFSLASCSPWPKISREGEILRIKSIPWLMLSSPTNPRTRFLYDLTLDGHGSNQIKLNREIQLPEIAGDYCTGSSHGFIFSVPTRCSPDIVAVNPLTGATLSLPPTSSLSETFSRYPNLIEAEDGTFQAIKPGTTKAEVLTIDLKYCSLSHSIITPSPSLDIVVLIRRGLIKGYDCHLARLSSSSSSSSAASTWTSLPLLGIESIDDCIFHRGRLLFVNSVGTLAGFKDIGDPFNPQPIFRDKIAMLEAITDDECDEPGYLFSPYRKYLVESPDGEDLFLVCRMEDEACERLRTHSFEVFSIDKNEGYEWKPVDSLGGLAFFVGPNRSFSLRAADFPTRLKPDCVYFTDDIPPGYLFNDSGERGMDDTGVFSLRDGTTNFFQITDGANELSWPPPLFIVPTAC